MGWAPTTYAPGMRRIHYNMMSTKCGELLKQNPEGPKPNTPNTGNAHCTCISE